MKPSVSIVVPLYNKERYINRCIDSIFAQTFPGFELLIVDDGSTDASPDRVRAYNDSRLHLITQTNAGPGAARNRGLVEAQSDLVAFLDGDDAWHPDYLKRSLDRFAELPASTAALNWGMRIYPQNETTEARWRERGVPTGAFRMAPSTPASQIIAILANMLPSSCVLRRKAALEAGGYYAKYRCLFSEDAHLYLRLMLHNGVYFDPEPLTIRYEDASELALGHTGGARPIEPFLIDPADVRNDCPAELRTLLDRVLAARALKTAAVYGYWGNRSKAGELFRDFVQPARDWNQALFWTAAFARTPLGPVAGSILRAMGR